MCVVRLNLDSTMKSLFPRIASIACLFAPFTCWAQSAALITTFTNPTPAANDQFGFSVAPVGTDRVLVGANRDDTGATDAGAAYLFSTNGVLLRTFANPTPQFGERFGYPVAALGTDRVLIGSIVDVTGAFLGGAAYLFSTNGTLLTTITNPTPADFDYFGWSVAAVGSDRIVVGAVADQTGAPSAGAAYLFNANGTLLTTFTNPAPAPYQYFGWAVAALGSDRVLVGARSQNLGATGTGAAYLFRTNGVLLTTFTNPTPEPGDGFGCSVAALGGDRVLIGASWDRTGAYAAGAVYLFSTSAVLLTTFTNPAPVTNDNFGCSLAAVGVDRVLIGASLKDAGATDAGAAYLFNTNGLLLAAITNPAPAISNQFGTSVAAIGTSAAVIGAVLGDVGAVDAGAAYLFGLPPPPEVPPSLSARLSPPNTVVVSWPSSSTGYTLQQNTSGPASTNWTDISSPVQDDGVTTTFTVNLPSGSSFFRLVKLGQNFTGTIR